MYYEPKPFLSEWFSGQFEHRSQETTRNELAIRKNDCRWMPWHLKFKAPFGSLNVSTSATVPLQAKQFKQDFDWHITNKIN